MYELVSTEQGLCLSHTQDKKELPIVVDFSDKALTHRRLFLRRTRDGLVKAVHKNNQQLSILDVTAGLGQDSFLLASLGHHVTLLERSPSIAALLKDGLERAKRQVELAPIVDRMHLIHEDSFCYLQQTKTTYDVIFCDPMFPISKKSRAVRKEMRALSQIAGSDLDAAQIVELAKKKAKLKVVVKRPRLALPLSPNPCYSYIFKACRFDVYVTL